MSRSIDIAERIPERTIQDWEDDGRAVTLRRRKFGTVGTGILRLFRIPPMMTVHLDPLGSAVWRSIDGRSVAQILKRLQEEHPDEPDLGPRLGQYMASLAGHGFVRFR